MSKRLPSFFIVGAAKSGTSSLWHYLKQHPSIFMSSPKEPNFFVFKGVDLHHQKGPSRPDILYRKLYRNSILNFDEYQNLFEDARDIPAVGEASVRYLYFPETARRIHEKIPDAKIIVMLRNPIERLYSHYNMNYRSLLEPLSLDKALDREAERIQAGWDYDWHYTKVGMYYPQIEKYINCFGRENVKVIIYDDFNKNPIEISHEVYRFLGVDDSFNACIQQRLNEGYRPRNLLLQKIILEPDFG
ncbi:MAG: sulfotransferase [Cyanobacteria bacterium SID2]|nr:sulfotransferase [Cyanobacteria bacterium SID2]MBP0003858.1 sulfotransferase [Cyanobacteria bacterium SBC]